MKEVWKDIPDFPGYQVSNTGKVRSFWRKQKKFGVYGGTERILCSEPQHELLQSDDGNGYMKVYLQNDHQRRCIKVHRLVAEAFIPRTSEDFDTVDHILSGREGKLDNSVDNLRWISRRENIQKAYRDGMCNDRIESQKKCVLVTDIWDGQQIFFSSVKEAADFLNKDSTTVVHALKLKDGFDTIISKHFKVEYIDGEDLLVYGGGDFDAVYYNY